MAPPPWLGYLCVWGLLWSPPAVRRSFSGISGGAADCMCAGRRVCSTLGWGASTSSTSSSDAVGRASEKRLGKSALCEAHTAWPPQRTVSCPIAEKQRGGCQERPQDSARARQGRLSGASDPSASPGEGPLELGARLRPERAGAACRGVAQAQGRRVQAAASGACGRSGSRGTSRLCARLEWTGSGARATTWLCARLLVVAARGKGALCSKRALAGPEWSESPLGAAELWAA